MSYSINRVVQVGRLVRDPETRQVGDASVTSFTIAVDKGKDEAIFVRCSAWRKTGEFVANYLSKGRLVAVDGRLDCRKYTDKDGNSREAWEVVADSVQGLDRPRDEQGEVRASPGATTPHVGSDFDPFEDE
jgi:single-strand DNA-binding protein